MSNLSTYLQTARRRSKDDGTKKQMIMTTESLQKGNPVNIRNKIQPSVLQLIMWMYIISKVKIPTVLSAHLSFALEKWVDSMILKTFKWKSSPTFLFLFVFFVWSQALFRTVAMMVPDYALISEISLYSFGFVNVSIFCVLWKVMSSIHSVQSKVSAGFNREYVTLKSYRLFAV